MKTFKNNSFCKMVVLTSPGERKQKLDLYADLSTFLAEPTPHTQSICRFKSFYVPCCMSSSSGISSDAAEYSTTVQKRIVLQTQWRG